MKKIVLSSVQLLITLLLFLSSFSTISKAQENMTQNDSVETKSDSASSDQVTELEKILVTGERVYSTGSSRSIRDFDLNIRPVSTAQDMLQLAPGLVIAQHAGGGKAEQIFLRGFDADHGTDVAILSDSVPVNMVSHGHGQGYADIHFAIPELVESIDVFKGPYFARYGNFSTAGSVQFRTKDKIDGNMLKIEGGEFNTQKFTGMFQIPTISEHQNAYFAGQFYNTDGPVESVQDFQRLNLFGKFRTDLNETSKLSVSASSFSSAWDASGQIPQRAVESSLISRFGTIDDLEGGQTGRQNLNLIYTTTSKDNSSFIFQPYFCQYNFKLFSNFTFFLNDPENGDMIEQTDDRTIVGLNTEYNLIQSIYSIQANTTFGGGFRADDIAVSLWHSPNRRRLTQRVDSGIIERNLFLWAQEELIISPKLRFQLGLRGDYFTFNVEDRLDTSSDQTVNLPHASGYAQEAMLNPKFNMVISPIQSLDVFLNFGTGFHSNDARDVVIEQTISDLEQTFKRQDLSENQINERLTQMNFNREHVGIRTLPRAIGAEFGTRYQFLDRINIGFAGWWLGLDEELVFVGDAGETEISGKSQRVGIDIEGRGQILSWLWVDADVNLSQGKYVDEPADANQIPLAPRITSTGGVTAMHPSGWDVSLRYRYIGDRPANEDGSLTAEGYTLVNLGISYTYVPFKYFVTVENLFDVDWNEAQFDTESRLRNETDPVSEIHFTPGNPLNLQAGISFQF
ncbi:TonB-dependent receptor plug domain-containing protein [Candidatus Poribacteria bacterium]|nr:TonB-dependent receptor plug domain-containing protein [Candidatus Poribacteria bacterium]